eukprot:14817527-Ditylum_brightwellii.AAC.2
MSKVTSGNSKVGTKYAFWSQSPHPILDTNSSPVSKGLGILDLSWLERQKWKTEAKQQRFMAIRCAVRLTS